MRSILVLVAVFAAPLSACTTAAYQKNAVTAGSGATSGGDRLSGARLFASNCAVCHGPAGAGGAIGPSLRDESRRLSFEALASWIEAPEPPMPALYPKPLDASDVRDVAAYVETL